MLALVVPEQVGEDDLLSVTGKALTVMALSLLRIKLFHMLCQKLNSK